MNDTKNLISEVVPGFVYKKPDGKELKAIADSIGLNLTEEECAENSVDIRTMRLERDICGSCEGLESCGVDVKGNPIVFSGRGMSGKPCFGVSPCKRLLQYRETRRNEEALASCKIPSVLRTKTFKNYDGKENPHAVMIASAFIRGERTKGAIFYGGTGVGKTHLAAAILNNRIIEGQSGVYVTVPDLMDSLRSAMRENRIEDARAMLIDTDVLFLDDMGAENPTEFVVEELFKIINGRWLNGKRIIGTTNLSPSSFRQRYTGLGGERIFSRLSELCEWVEMTGRDHRV